MTFKLDASIHPDSLAAVPAMVREAESAGLDGLWTSETQHDPFLPLALAGEHSDSIELGTAVAIGFARSPGVLAYTAWDLAKNTNGRFILGLGTQVRAHIERRFGMTWPDSPAGKLRELIAAIRALWDTWQTGSPLNFRGEYFKLTLMSPFFNPGPIEQPEIPIFVAGVNRALCQLTGEIGDGFLVHPLHTERYLREVVRPAIESGASRTSRDAQEIALSISVFHAKDKAEAEFLRSQIAFYASTPSYRAVMTLHGWEEVAEMLSSMARRGEWKQMGKLIDDDMLETFAIIAPVHKIVEHLEQRYSGIADRITLYRPFKPDDVDSFWHPFLQSLGK
jgi:probable F420-dependent oxidoreductase